MRLAESVTFGGSGLDRAAQLRGDAAALARMLADPAGGVLPIWRGKPLARGETGAMTAAFLPADHPVFAQAADVRVFLGLDDGRPRFAADISAWEPETVPDSVGAFVDPSEQRHPDVTDARFVELRMAMTGFSPRDAELIATAKAILGWHVSHGFCSACGQRSQPILAGWQRDCPACGAHHFPRTDPVVIMLITRGNRALLGRSPAWPEGMYSLLAGFVEPGEPIEAAVRREVMEETGIRVGRVDYLASQPWPFPASLMVGCRGEALSEDITIDPKEIEDAFWISREDMVEVIAGRHPRMRAPRQGAIAGFLLRNWVADRLD